MCFFFSIPAKKFNFVFQNNILSCLRWQFPDGKNFLTALIYKDMKPLYNLCGSEKMCSSYIQHQIEGLFTAATANCITSEDL